MTDDEFDQQLDEMARVWQRQGYRGPAPVANVRATQPLAWWSAAAAAAVVAVLLWPSTPHWPDTLRPLMRGSPLAATAPAPPAQAAGFRLPAPPTRSSCFSGTDDCDRPAG